MFRNTFLLTFITLLGFTGPAYAYLGPGMAGSAIATVIGIIGAFFLALFGILYYPIKRSIKNRKKNAKKEEASETEISAKTEN